ncbi:MULTISPECIES: hypothetical protein [unclassified Rathayibacter]|uniref:hypothetical protein n=1 Tax=unclassified Rathayibacter TaxID=2609250 RepID=UPI0006F79537|nr:MULTISPECIES: hypothetical protein [unclassified Rathayibacter]KQQ03368.1 hypothetical protein ASF42_07505 [Rathayibacter sp. Leaf294]KQS11823.1 hypothetical protein ASG06_07505 [Rathayibacter sp. Leaf185]
MGRIRFDSAGPDEHSDEEAPVVAGRGRPSRERGARFTAIALTSLSVVPAALLTVAFFLVRLPPLDRDDYPDWTAPSAVTLAPWLLLFLLPPIVTGALSRLVGGPGSFSGFRHYGTICFLVMVPFIGLSALSLLG